MIVHACYNLACLVNNVIYLVLIRLGLIYVLKRRIFTIRTIMCAVLSPFIHEEESGTREILYGSYRIPRWTFWL